ncbi:putative Amino acid transporter system N2 [Aduncisulcus paluster]|uniref:Amino acid transporter system N2 n=1 Tax=Aduncisulcus paluster TaxID=2918883 RepID=A0ABQ5KXE9_9EUKA|nr:putative Amino acid transporter system N2 [Aduncisulcus paluster]
MSEHSFDVEKLSQDERDDVPLLPPSTTKEVPVGTTTPAAIFNLTNTVIGAGVLTLPYAMKVAGLGIGLLLLVIIALASFAAFHFLVAAGNEVGESSYKMIAKKLWGKGWDYVCEIFVALYTLGTCCSYTIILSDYANLVIGAFDEHAAEQWYGSRQFCLAIIAILILFPLSMLQRIDFLKYTSFASLVCVIFVIVVVLVYWLMAMAGSVESSISTEPVVWAKGGIDVFLAAPLLGVSYTAHYNVLNIYNEMSNRSHKKFSPVISSSVIIVSITYLLMSIPGYLTWRDDTPSNILDIYPNSFIPATLARLALAITISFSYPLVQFALKLVILRIVGFNNASSAKRPYHIMISIFVLIIAVTLAMFVDDISIVTSFSGSLFGTNIVFTIPALFFFTIRKDTKSRVIAVIVAVVGVFFCVVGFWNAIRKAMGLSD